MGEVNEFVMAEAVQAFNAGRFTSISKCAVAYGLAESTLRDRLGDVQPRSIAHENQQLLSNIQEDWLVKWIIESEQQVHAPRELWSRKLDEI